MTTNQEVAKTIASQIGNLAFNMIGAANLACGEMNGGPALSFKIKASRTHKYCTVTLKGDDTYTVKFQSVNGNTVSEHEGIYADMLTNVIGQETGLAVRL